MDIQTAPSLYHYGCALLEVGRMETGVLTNAFDGGSHTFLFKDFMCEKNDDIVL